MTQTAFDGFSIFANNVAKLRRATAPMKTQTSKEVIDDVVVIGVMDAEWDKQERDGRIYMTRR
jgi:hypothetical protein